MKPEDFKPGVRCAAYVGPDRLVGKLVEHPMCAPGTLRIDNGSENWILLVSRHQCRLLKKKNPKQTVTRAELMAAAERASEKLWGFYICRTDKSFAEKIAEELGLK